MYEKHKKHIKLVFHLVVIYSNEKIKLKKYCKIACEQMKLCKLQSLPIYFIESIFLERNEK